MAEKQYYVGTQYNNEEARLIAISEPIKNSIKCKCSICGAEESYKLSDLKEGKVTACKSCKQGIEIGDTIGGMTVVKHVIACNKFGIQLRCTKCNKLFLHDVATIKSKGYQCPLCKRAEAQAKKESQLKIKPKETFRKEATKKNLLGNIASFDREPVLDLSKYRVVGDFIFTGKVMRASATGVSVRELLKGQCMHCGSNTIESENYFSKNEYKCQKCNKINNDRRNIIENTNWVGYVRHNIEIVKTKKNSSGVLMADTKCLACGHEMTIPVVTIISEPELTCIKCGDTPITVECPLCHKNHIKTTLRRLYEKRDSKTMTLCGSNTVPYSEIALQHETATRLENIRKRYKGYTLEERIPGHDETPAIFKFKENYTGTDGNVYHTCMCEVHNKLMVLTDDEIRSYKHEYCADTRMMPYNPNAKHKK